MDQRKNNPIVNPYFDDTQYKGQDIVHEGIRIPLHGEKPEDLLPKFSRRARRIIENVETVATSNIRFKVMTDDDLPALRSMWFDPDDVTFPREMGDHVGITALEGDVVIGGAIWAPAGRSLFLHQLVSSDRGKKHQIPTRLIWVSVGMYFKEYHSLDIGVSYNPKRYHFFKNFAVETYPIILKKPFYVPVIRFSPFRSFTGLREKPNNVDYKGEKMTFVPRASFGLQAILKHRNIAGEHVGIIKTFDSPFVSGCVTEAITKAGATWEIIQQGISIQKHITIILAIHEFGIPITDSKAIFVSYCKHDYGLPVIEDCAWRDDPVWEWSDYQIFSMQKILNVNYGGIVRGLHLSDDELWSMGILDSFKRDRFRFEKLGDVGKEKRKVLWWLYHQLVLADGMKPYGKINWDVCLETGWMPTVYMQEFGSDKEANEIVERLQDFGIQAGRYWPEPVVYLPIHQNMSVEEVRYMFAVVRGYFNLCRDYRGATINAEVNHD